MSGETARTDADELERIIAIIGQRNWSRGTEHDATDVAEAIAELAQRELERLTQELADEKAFHAKTADNFEVVAAGWSEERERLTREFHERQRECALSRARDGLQRFGADKAIDARAREIAEAAGWSCYSADEGAVSNAAAEGEQP